VVSIHNAPQKLDTKLLGCNSSISWLIHWKRSWQRSFRLYTQGFWTNMYQLPHKRKKELCLTPKQQFRLMMQDPFLLCLCQRGAFTGFSDDFFAVLLNRKPYMTAKSINGTSRHTRLSARKYGLPYFTLRAMSFSFGGFLVSRISLLKFSV